MFKSCSASKPGDEVLREPHADQCVIRRDEGSSALQWKGNVLVHQGTMRESPEAVLAELRNEHWTDLAKDCRRESIAGYVDADRRNVA